MPKVGVERISYAFQIPDPRPGLQGRYSPIQYKGSTTALRQASAQGHVAARQEPKGRTRLAEAVTGAPFICPTTKGREVTSALPYCAPRRPAPAPPGPAARPQAELVPSIRFRPQVPPPRLPAPPQPRTQDDTAHHTLERCDDTDDRKCWRGCGDSRPPRPGRAGRPLRRARWGLRKQGPSVTAGGAGLRKQGPSVTAGGGFLRKQGPSVTAGGGASESRGRV